MTERSCTKEITNLLGIWPVWGAQQFFPLHPKGFRGQILTNDTRWHSPRTTRKSGFFDWKRPKEGERVAQGHFHKRVGESPYENLGTSGSKKSLFVPRYSSLMLELLFDKISLCKIWPVLEKTSNTTLRILSIRGGGYPPNPYPIFLDQNQVFFEQNKLFSSTMSTTITTSTRNIRSTRSTKKPRPNQRCYLHLWCRFTFMCSVFVMRWYFTENVIFDILAPSAFQKEREFIFIT